VRQDAKTHFDNIAERYRGVPETWKSVYEAARGVIEPVVKDKIILDVGNGGFFPYDTKLPKKTTVLDLSPAMLEKISDPNVAKVVGDARTLEAIADGSLDVILFILCLHHINGKSPRESNQMLDDVFRASHAKLKRSGTLLVVEPFFGNILFNFERAFYAPLRWALGKRQVSMIFFYTLERMKKSLARAFGVSAGALEVQPLPVEGWVDPMGGTFPGRIKIPANLCPTKYFLIQVKKT
jgi:hypothetical protein